ncbi:MAG: inverse autotransporter beta domain-containing protein [Chlamydiae bacterium]|nr:inverse autotransporter beta domain-containing protein [Chlamydiota bacterium]
MLNYRYFLLFVTCFSLSKFNVNAKEDEFDKQTKVQQGFWRLRHLEGTGIGFNKGYTSTDLFLSTTAKEKLVPYLDLRGHIFNDGRWAANGGIGVRSIYADCKAFGFNGYYDYRQAKHAHFHQIGLGFEYIYPLMRFWANGYIPVSRHKKNYRKRFDEFEDNFAFFVRKSQIAFFGLDGGLGGVIFQRPHYNLEAQGAIYYLRGSFHEWAVGGLFRLKAKLTEYGFAQAQVSYDTNFRWRGSGEIGFRLPLGKELKSNRSCSHQNAFENQLVSQPERFEIMPVDVHRSKRRAIDPLTGNPLFFIFVDNTSGSDGTFESPFATLAAAEAASRPNNVIYIFPGDETTAGMANGIILKDNQQLIGSAADMSVLTPFGQLTIPAQTTTRPKLTTPVNGATTVVTAANQNTISGLHLISGNVNLRVQDKTNVIITNNIFESPQAVAISCNNVAGIVMIDNNRFQGSSFTCTSVTPAANQDLTCFIRNNVYVGMLNFAMIINSNLNNKLLLYHIENNFSLNRFNNNAIVLNNITGSTQSSVNYFLINNNLQSSDVTFTSTNGGSAFMYYELRNNIFDASVAADAYFIDLPGPTIAEVQLLNNIATTGNFNLSTSAVGRLVMQSSDFALTGVQAANTGTFTTTGTLRFIPVLPSRAQSPTGF